MRTIRLKKGYSLNVRGAPTTELHHADAPSRLALAPAHIPFMKPRLKIAKGDPVALGSPLIEDKRNTSIQILSPGGGRVADIRFGPRRVIEEIVIQLDEDENVIEFERYSPEEIRKMHRDQLIQALIAGGLWPLIKELPFRDYARPDSIPPALYIALDSLEPFHPDPRVYLDGNEAHFRFGLDILQKLVEGPVYVYIHDARAATLPSLNGVINLTYTGKYPAHDPGVLLYRMKTSANENHAWFIQGRDVLSIARLLHDGRYPTENIVSVGGAGVPIPRHVMSRNGAPLNVLAAAGADGGDWRYIQGGILTGYKASSQSYLGFADAALNVLPEGNRKGELLGLFNPGYRKPTYSTAFLSALNRDELDMDCNMHGGDRACIACGYCALVCPVDILPQFTFKAILAGEVEESLEHGLLDCVECGLCAYVCPSKIDLYETLKQAKADVYKEQAKQ